MHAIVVTFLIILIMFLCAVNNVSDSRRYVSFYNEELNSIQKMLLTLDKRSLTTLLFKMNNKSLDFCEHGAENRDLNNCLLIRLLFTKIILNDDYKKLCSYSSTPIKIIFTMCFIMNDDRLIINLSSRLIVAFNFFCNERDDFESKKSSSLKLESKLF